MIEYVNESMVLHTLHNTLMCALTMFEVRITNVWAVSSLNRAFSGIEGVNERWLGKPSDLQRRCGRPKVSDYECTGVGGPTAVCDYECASVGGPTAVTMSVPVWEAQRQ